MPRRIRRSPEAAAGAAATPAKRSDPPTWALAPGFEVRHVGGQKEYRCPGCDHLVRAGAWHLVVVPRDDVDARRHWHVECWRKELRRQGRRVGGTREAGGDQRSGRD